MIGDAGVVGPDSGTGFDAGGQVVAGVGPDSLVDPGGPTGVEGKPANRHPFGLPLGSVGPEGAPKGAVGPKILFMASI